MTPERTTAPSIERAELVRIVGEGMPYSMSERGRDYLIRVATEVSRIAVGGGDVDGVGCPMIEVERRYGFDVIYGTQYDRLMRDHLKLGPEPVVVTVTDPKDADD